MLYHRRSHPYARNETKRATNETNLAYLTTKSSAGKINESRRSLDTVRSPVNANENTNSTRQNVHKIGQYLIIDANPASAFSRAINCHNRTELTCKIVDAKCLGDVLAPYSRLESHENINDIIDVIVGESKAYIFMANSFGDLHSYVKTKKRLREDEAQKLFRQIVNAVCLCHEAGIVLRDLKLRKFVFRNKDRTELKLECLEDARVLDGLDDTLEDKHGCPAYVSPELLHNSDGYSGKLADIWSLGVMLYTMLVGRYPFQDVEPTVMFSKIQRGLFVVPDSLSSKAKCLIKSMMRQDPKQRLSASELLEHPWFKSTNLSSSLYRYDKKSHDQTVPSMTMDKSFFVSLKGYPTL